MIIYLQSKFFKIFECVNFIFIQINLSLLKVFIILASAPTGAAILAIKVFDVSIPGRCVGWLRLRRRFLLGPGGSHVAAERVDKPPLGVLVDALVDAEVLAGRHRDDKIPVPVAVLLLALLVHALGLVGDLLDLRDGPRAVEELAELGAQRPLSGRFLVPGDEAQQCDGLPRPGGHFQHARVVLCRLRVQSSLQEHHVLVLLWINVLVREYHFNAINIKTIIKKVNNERKRI